MRAKRKRGTAREDELIYLFKSNISERRRLRLISGLQTAKGTGWTSHGTVGQQCSRRPQLGTAHLAEPLDEADCWERTLSRLGSTGGQRHVALKETKAARQREQVFSDRSERWYMFVVQRSEDLR